MTERRRLAVLTTGRQDYGILRSTLLLLREDPRFELTLWAGGMHLSPAFGRTVERVKEDGFRIDREIQILAEGADVAAECARALTAVSQALSESGAHALVVVGDRYETLAAAFAATVGRVPIVHLYGGEETEGAVDNAFRHAITKLAHLHLVSHEAHARRVVQMGEPRATVRVVGAAGLDNLYRHDLPGRAELEQRLGLALAPPVVAVTVHPATLGEQPLSLVEAVASAMEQVPATYVVTQPNSDAGGDVIREFWKEWTRNRARVALVEALGETYYWGLLKNADAVLGNSSSGLIEAPSAGLPVVNVGDRQLGRLRSGHIVDVPGGALSIERALASVLAPAARERYRAMPTLFPTGPAAPRIVEALSAWNPPKPPRKEFVDLPGVTS